MLNAGYCYRETLGGAAVGHTALSYLVERYPHSLETTWKERIDAGRVSLDGSRAEVSTPLVPGAELAWHRPPWIEPDAPSSFAVLYRDAEVVAVAKPRGMPAMPGGGFLEKSLLRRVSAYDRAAAPLHRLGRGTSGITLFTLHKAARRYLTEAWRSGAVERKYVGLVRGRPPWLESIVDAPIGRVPHARLGRVAAVSRDGKRAETHVRVVERREHTTLVEVTLATGRTHQIRIHLAASGYPLDGDPLYPPGGVPDAGTTVLPGALGYHLHAHSLRFPRSARGDSVTLTCIPPPILRRIPVAPAGGLAVR